SRILSGRGMGKIPITKIPQNWGIKGVHNGCLSNNLNPSKTRLLKLIMPGLDLNKIVVLDKSVLNTLKGSTVWINRTVYQGLSVRCRCLMNSFLSR
ncbi:MAG: hypothetical protein JXA46_00780, partial [Dehalococcoidales bacterium]|nr:hypothetical protein [Dehalococcoidales bacterium]